MNKAPESIAAYQKALALDPKEEQAALGSAGRTSTPRATTGDRRLRPGDPDRPEDDGRRREHRHRVVLLLQARHGPGEGLRRQGRGGGPRRDAAQGEHRQDQSSSPPACASARKRSTRRARAAGLRARQKLEAANNAVHSRNPATRARASARPGGGRRPGRRARARGSDADRSQLRRADRGHNALGAIRPARSVRCRTSMGCCAGPMSPDQRERRAARRADEGQGLPARPAGRAKISP